MKGYGLIVLFAFLYVTDAAHFAYPDLEKGEDEQAHIIETLKAAIQELDDELAEGANIKVTTTTAKAADHPDTTTVRVETTTKDDDDDDKNDFPKWGAMCDHGQLQSPIELSTSTSLNGRFHNFKFTNYEEDLDDNTRIVNNGHTVLLRKFKNEMTVTGGHLPGVFILEQMHFHWSSEHTIDKLRYPLELHIVNRNTNYKNITEAASKPDGIAVFAVLFHVSVKDNQAIRKILESADEVQDSKQINVEVDLEEKFDVEDFLPKDKNDEYFTYHGSLTTPTCAESVIWTVYQNTLPVSLKQISEFEKFEEDDGDEIKNNYRFLQKTHRRKVIYVKDDDDDGLDDDDDPEAAPPTDDDNDAGGAMNLGVSGAAIAFTMIVSFINNQNMIV